MNLKPTVDVQNLKRHFRAVKAVDGISFSFEAGQVMGFIGPNGAGKTTAMRILATLDDPTDGDVRINGLSVREEPEAVRRMIGYVPDALPTHSDMTVHEYLDFFARAYGMTGAALRGAVQGVKEFTSLVAIENKLLKTLSKGMKQRVSLGRALIHDPAVLIMDEPTAGLDPRARIEFRELTALLARQGKAILISSHILTELAELCSAVVIIEKGHLLEAGHIRDVAERDRRLLSVLIRTLDPVEAVAKTLLELPGVEQVRQQDGHLEADLAGGEAEAGRLLADLIGRGHRVVEFRPTTRDLESIFLRVTRGDVQ